MDLEGAEPVYLEFSDALELYAAIVGGTTVQAADQLRDRAGLESALGRPRNYALYEHADLALLARAFRSHRGRGRKPDAVACAAAFMLPPASLSRSPGCGAPGNGSLRRVGRSS